MTQDPRSAINMAEGNQKGLRMQSQESEKIEVQPILPYTRRDVWTLSVGEVVLTRPSCIEPEEIEDVKAWMKLQANRLSRLVKRVDEE